MPDSTTQLETVNMSRNGAAATIELNRPQALNAWNAQFGADLLAAVRELAADEAVRAVLVTGAGRGFSSGADLKDSGAGQLTDDGRVDVQARLTEVYHPIMETIREMPKPVVAAVNGPAVAFVNIGLVPDGGSSLFLPTRVGMARSAELMMLGERLPAAKALEWGLINRVVPDGELAAEAAALAARLAEGPTRSYAGAKRELNNWIFARMREQLDLEAQLQQEMAGSEDFIEGVTAFMQKRPANFSGR